MSNFNKKAEEYGGTDFLFWLLGMRPTCASFFLQQLFMICCDSVSQKRILDILKHERKFLDTKSTGPSH